MWFWQNRHSPENPKEKESTVKSIAQKMLSKSLFRRTSTDVTNPKVSSGSTSYFMTQQHYPPRDQSAVRRSSNMETAPSSTSRTTGSSTKISPVLNSSSPRTPILPSIDQVSGYGHTGRRSNPLQMPGKIGSVTPARQVSDTTSKSGSTFSNCNNSEDPKRSSKSSLCCDKCDGKHETDDCPHYKKSRETHPDAQKNFYKKMGGTSNLPGALFRTAKVVRQPGDGSCLFHSMSYGLRDGSTASTLRTEICAFVQRNPSFKICDTPLSDWVKWDSGTSCTDYARKMSRGSWGGGIEMACAAHIKGVNVHVYERTYAGYKRISAFDHPSSPESRRIVRVLYQGGVHYDALVVD